ITGDLTLQILDPLLTGEPDGGETGQGIEGGLCWKNRQLATHDGCPTGAKDVTVMVKMEGKFVSRKIGLLPSPRFHLE
ncbi:hypothetical protein G114_01959, partial [Aeromonas diversa CDC 2478-85]